MLQQTDGLFSSTLGPYLSLVYEKASSDHWPKTRLAAHNPGMITLSDERTWGRRYGRNGVETSLPWSETHFLMHNKALILLAVTRGSLLARERGRDGVQKYRGSWCTLGLSSPSSGLKKQGRKLTERSCLYTSEDSL